MVITISRLSRSLVVTSITISLNSLGTSVIVAYARGVTISRLSRSLVVTSIAISLNTLGTSVVITYTGDVTISRFSRSFAIISFSKSLSSSVDMAVSSIPITRLSLPLAIISAVPSQALGAPVLRAVTTIRVISYGID